MVEELSFSGLQLIWKSQELFLWMVQMVRPVAMAVTAVRQLNVVRMAVMIAVKQHFQPVPVEQVEQVEVPVVEFFFLQIPMHQLRELFQ